MRSASLFLFLLFLISPGLRAQESAQLVFDEANTFLQEGNYPEAMDRYRTILASDQVSGALFLNMGIASTQLDSMGLAKYYFIKASEFPTTNEQAMLGLEYVNSQFSRQSAQLPKLPWDRAIDSLKDGIGSEGVFIIGFIFIITGVLLILLNWFGSMSFKKFRTVLALICTAGVLIIILAFYVDYIDNRYSEAVIVSTEKQVKSGASDSADLVSLAYEGYTVTIDNNTSLTHDGWYYIRLGNGQFGWITRSGTRIL